MLLCGDLRYYDQNIGLVTNNYRKACSFISKHIGLDIKGYEKFSEIQYWENNKMIFRCNAFDYEECVKLTRKLTIKEVDEYIKKAEERYMNKSKG